MLAITILKSIFLHFVLPQPALVCSWPTCQAIKDINRCPEHYVFNVNTKFHCQKDSTVQGIRRKKKKKKLNGRRGHLAAYVMISIMQIDCLTKGNQQGWIGPFYSRVWSEPKWCPFFCANFFITIAWSYNALLAGHWDQDSFEITFETNHFTILEL